MNRRTCSSCSPVLGIGLGTGWATPGMQEPHNLGLQLLGETGIVGLLGFLAVAFVVGRFGGGLMKAGTALRAGDGVAKLPAG